jgi:hypothetical protein
VNIVIMLKWLVLDQFRLYGGGGSGGGGSSTTKQEIPEELKPLASAYTNKAINLGNQQFTPYSGQRYADLNPTQNSALEMIQNRATNGSATIGNAETNLNQMIDGESNPYLDGAVDRALGQVQSRVNSQFGGNNYGTTAHQETLARALGDQANSMYYGAYDADQGRRMQAIGMAPTFGNQAYQDAGQMLNAGQILQDQAQQGKDFDYEQFQEQQNLPYKQLAAMSGVFGTNLGSTSTTQQSGGGGK